MHVAIGLIRDQVDQLQIQAAERKRPWYRQPSLQLSLLALAVSVTFSSLGVYFRLQDKLDADKEVKVGRIRANVSRLAELQIEQGNAIVRAGNSPQQVANVGSSYNTIRQLLIEDTESLINASATQMTSAVYVSFANQLANDLRTKDATVYFELALRSAKTSLARANVHRGYAMMLMLPGPQMKLDDGRAHWRTSLAELARAPDDNATFQAADILRVWAFGERSVGNGRLADSLLVEARRVTGLIANSFSRVQMERLLADSLTPTSSAPSNAIAPAVLFGDWNIRLADGRRGVLSLSLNTYSQTWTAQITLTEAGRIIEIRQGFALPTDGRTMQLNWQSQRSSGTSSIPVSGTTRLRRTGTGGFTGTDEPLGGVPMRIDLTFDPASSGLSVK